MFWRELLPRLRATRPVLVEVLVEVLGEVKRRRARLPWR